MTMSQENVKRVADAIEAGGAELGGKRAVVVGPAIPRAVIDELERRGVVVVNNASAVADVVRRAGATVVPGSDVKPHKILGPAGRPLEPPVAKRSCAGCDACCQVMGVRGVPGHADGVKPPHTRCENQSPGGCSVYADRPTPCRTYRCAWLEGQWTDAERPDRLGVIFDAGSGAINAREVFRGGFNRERAKRRLLELHRMGLHVKLVPYKLRRLPTAKHL